ncbi:MAG: YggT family protein [Clostridiaceae bacterium]|nr:YggT family protein [Clostridiaceae bacterium]
MYQYLLYCFNIFFLVLEVIVLVYLVQDLLRLGPKVRYFLLMLISPMLFPMRNLVKHSILNTFSMDLSPYILLIILAYLERVCTYLQMYAAV